MEQIILLLQSALLILQFVSTTPQVSPEFRATALEIASSAVAHGTAQLQIAIEEAALIDRGYVPTGGGATLYVEERANGWTRAEEARHGELSGIFNAVTQYQTDGCATDRARERRDYFTRSFNFDPDKEPERADGYAIEGNAPLMQIRSSYDDCMGAGNTKYKTPAQMDAYKELKALEDKR